ncbi:DUF5134 domain-containing protein, partial [Streptomyces sp. NPDC087850]
MHGPAATSWLLVALCAVAGGYCLLRLRSGVAEQRGSAGAEALMGFGMAAMAVPAAGPGWIWMVYVLVFGGAAAHTLISGRGTGHRAHHLLSTLAMAYMAAAMAAGPDTAHGAHTAGGAPLVTGALLVYFTGYVLWTGTRLMPLPASGGAAVAGGTAPLGWGD